MTSLHVLVSKDSYYSGVGACFKDLLKQRAFNHLEKQREEEEVTQEGTRSALCFLLGQVLTDCQCSARGLCTGFSSQVWRRWEELTSGPKEQTAEGFRRKEVSPSSKSQHAYWPPRAGAWGDALK